MSEGNTSLNSTDNLSPENKRSKNSRYYIETIAHIVKEIIEENEVKDELKLKYSKTEDDDGEVFDGKKIPGISIVNFLDRILNYTYLEDSTLIISFIYLDRICEIGNQKMKHINIHRLILASVVLAIKYNEDDYYDNTYYAKVGGITFDELCDLEEAFIKKINYTLFVSDELFEKYEIYLNKYNNLS